MIDTLRKRPRTEDVVKIETYINRLREEIQETEKLANFKNSDAWDVLKKVVERKLAGIESDFDSFERMNSDEKTIKLSERRVYKLLLSFIDYSDMALEAVHEKLAQAEQDLNELKTRVG